MRIRIAVPDAHVTPAILNAALEATTLANQAALESGAAPISHAIKRGKVLWKPEPFKDGEHFDLLTTVQRRGWGDCDDLAPAYAAELRATGRDPDARAVVKKSGPKRWHAVVQRGDGGISDPSKAAGMRAYQRKYGSRFVPGVVGAVLPTMARRSALGLKRRGRYWAARCDLPIDGAAAALCGVALCPTMSEAIDGAIDAVTTVGSASELVDPYDVARALALQAALQGDDIVETIGELEDDMPPEHVVGFFGSIAKAVKSAIPLAKHLPIPGAAAISDAASAMLNKGGGGGGGGGAPPAGVSSPSPFIAAQGPAPSPMPLVTSPSGTAGPIIIRF